METAQGRGVTTSPPDVRGMRVGNLDGSPYKFYVRVMPCSNLPDSLFEGDTNLISSTTAHLNWMVDHSCTRNRR